GPARCGRTGCASWSLNEGRDSRPGNGREDRSVLHLVPAPAQRGPGLASRQRRRAGLAGEEVAARSTRAGTRVPATAAPPAGGAAGAAGGRSTRAGTRVPATGRELGQGHGR